MDTNKRKTGLARLIEIAGTKRRLLIGAMLLAVITAIMQFVPIIAVYNILIELAEHALDPSLIDKAYIWLWSFISPWELSSLSECSRLLPSCSRTLPLSTFCMKYECS